MNNSGLLIVRGVTVVYKKQTNMKVNVNEPFGFGS